LLGRVSWILVIKISYLFKFTVLWRNFCRKVMHGRVADHRYLKEI